MPEITFILFDVGGVWESVRARACDWARDRRGRRRPAVVGSRSGEFTLRPEAGDHEARLLAPNQRIRSGWRQSANKVSHFFSRGEVQFGRHFSCNARRGSCWGILGLLVRRRRSTASFRLRGVQSTLNRPRWLSGQAEPGCTGRTDGNTLHSAFYFIVISAGLGTPDAARKRKHSEQSGFCFDSGQ